MKSFRELAEEWTKKCAKSTMGAFKEIKARSKARVYYEKSNKFFMQTITLVDNNVKTTGMPKKLTKEEYKKVTEKNNESNLQNLTEHSSLVNEISKEKEETEKIKDMFEKDLYRKHESINSRIVELQQENEEIKIRLDELNKKYADAEKENTVLKEKIKIKEDELKNILKFIKKIRKHYEHLIEKFIIKEDEL